MEINILNKFFYNRCHPNEVDEVFSWIHQTDEPTCKLVFKEYWNKINADIKLDDPLTQKRLDQIHHRINIQQSKNRYSGKIRSFPSKKAYTIRLISRVAVTLLIPVITLFLYTHFFQSDFIANNEVISPPGARTSLMLPDGTKVWLNHGSKMIYPQQFVGKIRKVSLTGEGYFEVTHNPAKPFIVEAEGMQVEAVGTRFNVRAYDDGSDFEATLEKGKIVVQRKACRNKSALLSMKPGQHLALNLADGKYLLKFENPEKYVAWKEGKLIFDNDHLDKVAEQLSQWYNVEIELKDAGLRQLTYKATFVNESLAQILDMMQVVMPIVCVNVQREKASDGTFRKKKIFIYLKK